MSKNPSNPSHEGRSRESTMPYWIDETRHKLNLYYQAEHGQNIIINTLDKYQEPTEDGQMLNPRLALEKQIEALQVSPCAPIKSTMIPAILLIFRYGRLDLCYQGSYHENMYTLHSKNRKYEFEANDPIELLEHCRKFVLGDSNELGTVLSIPNTDG